MSGFNRVILLGHLGKDPELRYTQSGTPVCRLSVATSRKFKGKDEQLVEETEWHRVVVWGTSAKNCGQYLAKGRQVHVEGRLQTQKWTDKEGVDRYVTEIVADGVQFVGSGSPAKNEQKTNDGGHGYDANNTRPDGFEDNIPF